MEATSKPKPERALCLEHLTYDLPADEGARKAYPLLFDLLTPRWKEGTMTRQPARLTVKADGGTWRVNIECPTEQRQTTILVGSLVTLWPEVENAISMGTVHWGLTWNLQKKNLPVLDDGIK